MFEFASIDGGTHLQFYMQGRIFDNQRWVNARNQDARAKDTSVAVVHFASTIGCGVAIFADVITNLRNTRY